MALTQEQNRLVFKLDKETLLLIKQEGELHLSDLANSTNIVISKASTLFNISIVIFTSIFAYLISKDPKSYFNSIIINEAIISLLFLAAVIYYLHRVIFLKKYLLQGSRPSRTLFTDVVKGENTIVDQTQYLYIVVKNIEKVIDINEDIHKELVSTYNKAINGLFCWFVTIIIYFVIFSTVLT